MPAREINPFTALTRILSQFLRTHWSTSNHQRVDTTTPQTAEPSGLALSTQCPVVQYLTHRLRRLRAVRWDLQNQLEDNTTILRSGRISHPLMPSHIIHIRRGKPPAGKLYISSPPHVSRTGDQYFPGESQQLTEHWPQNGHQRSPSYRARGKDDILTVCSCRILDEIHRK